MPIQLGSAYGKVDIDASGVVNSTRAAQESLQQFNQAAGQSLSQFRNLSEGFSQGASRADVARAGLDGLEEKLRSGAITSAQYEEVLGNVQTRFGLATKSSQEAATMIQSLNDQFARGEIDVAQYRAGLDDVAKSMSEAKGTGVNWAETLTGIQSGISIAKEALAGLKGVWDFAKEGAANQQIAASFERTAKSIGGNANDIIAKLDAAARGTIDDENLMQASTRALTLGVAQNGDDLVRVMQLARSAALAFGGDTGQAFETINYAIGNLTPRALKQFGIIVDLKKANEEYARANGLVVSTLTEEQQRQALLNAVLEQGQKNFGDIANAATTTSEKMKAVETRITDIIDQLKEFAATGIAAGLDIIEAPKKAMEAFSGTAEKLRGEVASGEISVTDYNNALKGMADSMSGVVAPALVDATLTIYKLSDAQAAQLQAQYDATRGNLGYASSTDESARAANRTAEALHELQVEYLDVAQGARNQAETQGVLDAAMDKTAAKAALLKSQEALVAGEMSDLKSAMAGALQNEFQNFNNKQDSLADKAAKVKEELDKLQASQGQIATSTKKHTVSANEATLAQLELAKAQHELDIETAKGTLTADQIAAAQDKVALNQEKLHGVTKKQIESSKQLTAAQQALKDAQAQLANNTDPMKQAKLAVEVDNLKTKLGQATGAVVSYIDNSKRIKELQGQYDEINKEIDANVAAHEKATKTILFGYAEQAIAQENARRGITGYTGEEEKALDTLAVKWGLKSQEDVDAMRNVERASQKLASGGSIEDFANTVGINLDKVNSDYAKAQGKIEDTGRAQSALDFLPPANLKVEADTSAAKKEFDNTAQQMRNAPPIEIPVKVVTVEDKAKAAAGDSLAERSQQARSQAAQSQGIVDQATSDMHDSMVKAVDDVDTAGASMTRSVQTNAVTAITSAGTAARSMLTSTQSTLQAAQSSIITAGQSALPVIANITSALKNIPTNINVKVNVNASGLPGGRAAGGPVEAGRPYIVGEKRPELFVPSVPGYVLPQVQPSAAQAAMMGQPAANNRQVIYNTQNQFYDGWAAERYLEQQRLQRIRDLAQAM